jgi:hypothetical protein
VPRYNCRVATPLSHDTSPEIEERQIQAWREMSVTDKAALITSMSAAARAMALAGVRHRFPNATPREQFLRLAIVTLGHDLARLAYPEIAQLDVR